MPTKADYVRAQPRDPGDAHTCHADGCSRRIKPSLFMCYPHWRMLPQTMQAAIWKHFRPGQEKDKRASAAYLDAARAAIEYVKAEEDKVESEHAARALRFGNLL